MVFHTKCQILLVILLLAFGQDHAMAQNQHEKIRATIDRFFDGMRTGDSSLVRSTLATKSSLSTILKNSTDSLIIRQEPAEQFIKAVGTPHNVIWDERIYDIIVHIDQPMATVWAPYKFYAGDKFSHCGVNVFILALSATGWKISSITDTRRKDNCP